MMREWSESLQRYKFLRQQLGRFDTLSLSALDQFKDVNRRYRGYALHSRCEYEQQLIDRSGDMPKLFYSYVCCKKKGKLSVGLLWLLGLSGELIDSPISMSECFVEAFSSVFVAEVSLHPGGRQVLYGQMEEVWVSDDEIFSVLADLDISSSMGPDGLHSRLLKICAVELSQALFIIFRRSLRYIVLPNLWLTSLVIPFLRINLTR